MILLLAAAGAAAWAWYCLERPYQGFAAQGVFVDLPHGASSRTVARLLKQNGVIRSAFAFEAYARRHPKRRLEVGVYLFAQPPSRHEVFSSITLWHLFLTAFIGRERRKH